MKIIDNLLAKSIKFDLKKDETIIHQGAANLFRSKDVSGGMLYLTSERLIFIAHKINFNKARQDIQLNQVMSLKQVHTFIVNNGLIVELKDRCKFRFVLNDRDKWIEEIGKFIK